MMRVHPSTNTNNIILNGNEMSMGDNINIPMDIKMLETTKSITRNGMKIRKPI